jgi:hypothetical protein
MKKLLASLVVIISIPFFTFGLLFLIAAAGSGKAYEFLVAVVLLAIATVLLVTGLRRLRRLATVSPDALKTEAVELARRLGGELTVSQLRAEYNISLNLATDVLEKLVAEGTAKLEQREERQVYVFTGLQASIAQKLCPYCGSKLPVRSDLRKCPNCGAQLEVVKS